MSIRPLLLIAAAISLLSCNAAVKEVDITADWDVEKLFRSARSELYKGNYVTAIERYEILESRYPFGKYATQAQLDIGYAYFRYEEPESAIAAIERFIKLNPRHESVAYAYYLRGLVNFGRGGSIMDKLTERDLSDFDRSLLQTSYRDFELVINKFPNSAYAGDARQRANFLRNELARSDLKIARFYASREAWVAVANRTRIILETFQGTSAVKPALEIQLKAYQALGLDQLAADTQRIIALNYGNSDS